MKDDAMKTTMRLWVSALRIGSSKHLWRVCWGSHDAAYAIFAAQAVCLGMTPQIAPFHFDSVPEPTLRLG